MIYGIFHTGSGLGNQLHRYVATRSLALDKGYEFSMIGQENFKGKELFKDIYLGEPNDIPYVIGPGGEVIPQVDYPRFSEKKVLEGDTDIRGYDPEINFVEDGTIIDGEFQDLRYFEKHLDEVDTWLETAPIMLQTNLCVIGFRGGEFQYIPELFLPQSYYRQAIEKMQELQPHMKFMAVTDDPATATRMLPDFVKVTHEVSTDWRLVRNAEYLILSNSSFFIFPALLNKAAKKIIAPRYWARRNTSVWALPQNYYPKFTYI